MRPFQVELGEDDYLAMLKSAVKGSPLTQRLIAAKETPAGRGRYVLKASMSEGMLLRSLALIAAPGAVRAIDRALAVGARPEK